VRHSYQQAFVSSRGVGFAFQFLAKEVAPATKKTRRATCNDLVFRGVAISDKAASPLLSSSEFELVPVPVPISRC